MTNEQIAELADKIQAECINWPDRFFDHDEAERLIRSALAAPAPQEEAKKPWPEVTLTAGAWRSLVAGLDEEGAEHETPITVCYDAEHDQGIYCYAEYPDDGARTIDPATPASAPEEETT